MRLNFLSKEAEGTDFNPSPEATMSSKMEMKWVRQLQDQQSEKTEELRDIQETRVLLSVIHKQYLYGL